MDQVQVLLLYFVLVSSHNLYVENKHIINRSQAHWLSQLVLTTALYGRCSRCSYVQFSDEEPEND